MKQLLQILTLFVLINTSLVTFSEKAEAQSVSFQAFYDDLSPYGNWYESPEYGYVWRPSLSGFTPYSTNGYWVLTDYGWTWVSDYSWGWAPFHYGRWYNDPLYGYVWVPGYEWGPGWVTWRRSNDYYGWAPIGPGVSISIAYSNGYNVPYNHWNFVRCNDFGRRDIHNYYIDRSKNVTIVNNTTVINTTKVDNTRRTTFNPGPDRTEVQRKVGKTINPVAIVDENKPTQLLTKNNVQLYRPVVENKDAAGNRPAPKKVIPRNGSKEQAVKAKEERNNEATNDRRAKPIEAKPDVDRQPVDQQKAKLNNDHPDRESQQRLEKKPVRDEQQIPVKRPPVDQQDKTNAQPGRQQPVPKQRDEQPQRTERPQRNEQPQPQQRTDRPQKSEQPQQKQQPDRPQRNEQPQPQQQPERPRPTEQRPVQQQHEKQQRAMPQQNMDRPAPQQPPRQAPAQRPPAAQKGPKG